MSDTTCKGCSAEITMQVDTLDEVEAVGLWFVTVRRPAGETVQSGPYCVTCMGELATARGVRLHESQA